MPKPPLYETIQRTPKLADRVAQQLQALISTQHLRPGDRLPPERDLAERFAVSRTVVREAVRSLVAKGLLEVHSGSGTFVRVVAPEAVTESLRMLLRSSAGSYDSVLEVRQLLEVEIARLAAERATPQDLAAMEQTIVALAVTEGDPEAFARADVAFHAALARATQNDLFVILHDSIFDALLEVRRKGAAQVPGTVQRALYHHSDILRCVRAHDPLAAQEAMRAHLEESRQTMLRVLA
jgi:GntR family transcriptional regulator, transcriptional repressor for pyruvate dehydrogenase complex